MSVAWESLDQLMLRAAERWPDRTFQFPSSGETLRYDEVAESADRLAGSLAAVGIDTGEVVALLQPTGPDFLVAFFGILRAGAIPTVLPQPMSRSSSHAARMQYIVKDAGARLLVAGRTFEAYARESLSVPLVRTTEQLAEIPPRPPASDRAPLALLQYTSGSTASPKGVALTHRNLRAGVDAIIERIELDDRDVNGQWIPLHHDMGLIGMLAGIQAGVHHHLWPPTEFVRRPGEWLRAFAERGATIHAGPNFAYQYMTAAIPESEVAQLDLSSWRVAFNGSEQVDPSVVERFLRHFAPAGVRPEVVRPVYGLAEATLAVTMPRSGEAPSHDRVDRALLADEGRAVPLADEESGGRDVSALGPVVDGIELRIATAGGRAKEREVGEIQLRGAPVMRGYFGRPRDPSDWSPDGWLRTGDLGYRVGDALYVTGRCKEMIILRGENLYPADVEGAVRDVPGLHLGRIVAFADARGAPERLVVLAESALGSREERRRLTRTLRSRLGRELGVGDAHVVLLRPDSIRRTTSGKPERLAMQALFAAGGLGNRAWETEDPDA